MQLGAEHFGAVQCDGNDNDTYKDKYKDKDEDKDNDKDKMLKRPFTCYIFKEQGVRGYQI